ncbi:MAG: hypothetical protein HY521_04770 [Proteobacteria bacterium]|nr:hypothetical protein [Pseudomonadota bacterium]
MFGLSVAEIVVIAAVAAVLWVLYKRVGGRRGRPGAGLRRPVRPPRAPRAQPRQRAGGPPGGLDRRRGRETSDTDDTVIDMVRGPDSETFVPVSKRRRKNDQRG